MLRRVAQRVSAELAAIRALLQRVPDLPAEVPVVGVDRSGAGVGAGAHAVLGGQPRRAVVVGMGEDQVLVLVRDVSERWEQRVAAGVLLARLGDRTLGAGVALQQRRRRDAGQRVVQRRLPGAGEAAVCGSSRKMARGSGRCSALCRFARLAVMMPPKEKPK
jgi:hypothetical protein